MQARSESAGIATAPIREAAARSSCTASRLSAADWLTGLGFVLLTALIAATHELGHDEIQAWNVSRAAALPWDVISTGWYEGHTPLWHLLLWPLTQLGNPELMQLLSVLFVWIIALRLLQDKPFPRAVCVLVLLGYFPLYEYSIVPRPYGVALLLCCLLASCLYRGGYTLLYLTLLCALIAFTSAFGTVLSVALMLLIVLDACQPHTRIRAVNRSRLLMALGLYAGVAALAVWFIVHPVASNAFETDVITGARMSFPALPQPLINAAFPHLDRLPSGIGEWVSTPPGAMLTLMAALMVACAVLVWLWQRPAAVVAAIGCVISISIAAAFVHSFSERHVGHLFMAGLLLCWAAGGLSHREHWQSPRGAWTRLVRAERAGNGTTLPTSVKALSLSGETATLARQPVSRWQHAAGLGLVLVLAYHAAIGAGAAALDVAREQSPWKRIAARIQHSIDEPYTLLLDSGYWAGGVSAYLDVQPYDLSCKCRRRYTQWNIKTEAVDATAMKAGICTLIALGEKPVVVATQDQWWPRSHLRLVDTFDRGYREPSLPDVRLYTLADPVASARLCEHTPHRSARSSVEPATDAPRDNTISHLGRMTHARTGVQPAVGY